jgi:hypothetical protein
MSLIFLNSRLAAKCGRKPLLSIRACTFSSSGSDKRGDEKPAGSERSNNICIKYIINSDDGIDLVMSPFLFFIFLIRRRNTWGIEELYENKTCWPRLMGEIEEGPVATK